MNLRYMSDEAAEAACLAALERINRRQAEAKTLNRAEAEDEHTRSAVYYREAYPGSEYLRPVVEAFKQAHQDLGISLDAFKLRWVKRVSETEYKAARGYALAKDQPVQGWLDIRTNTIVIDMNGTDIKRTALHEAYHLYQELNGIGRYGSAENEQAAEDYCQKATRPLTREEKHRLLEEYALRQMLAREGW